MRFELFLFVTLLVGSVGCAPNVAYVPLNRSPEPLTGRLKTEVEVFHMKVPDRPFTEVALLESQAAELGPSSSGALFGKLLEEAARRGCQGLIVGASDDDINGALVGHVGYIETRRRFRATCIVFRSENPPNVGSCEAERWAVGARRRLPPGA